MTSLQTSFRQNSLDCGNFVVLGSGGALGTGNFYSTTLDASGIPSSVVTAGDNFSSGEIAAIRATGAVLKDMGKMIFKTASGAGTSVGAGAAVYHKVQYVNPTLPETNGVSGAADTMSGTDVAPGFHTFYIRLQKNGAGDNNDLKVARTL